MFNMSIKDRPCFLLLTYEQAIKIFMARDLLSMEEALIEVGGVESYLRAESKSPGDGLHVLGAKRKTLAMTPAFFLRKLG